ncbi:SusC/RagA family TonB-linked outer membrane protein [Dyadobacter luteus]|jgi:TonB-linked SusC/RagA family outer membrane protein|uniref:SusC/RagA family TonB-linked outer membrane protein n=1 Tax=Dyadobacter luteus TaxID=2259619 RepID=A0A3D8Y547_9BACT|nr:SusC/RagA family TonB-linked outer membrane protein [Dyadobacter luteus]REA57522.1 SusC/RagA family TonB-linked outer membrane protein [Dyadobacter luteus]
MRKIILFCFTMTVLFSMHVSGQNLAVTGVVSAEDGSILPGVSITVKGTTRGTTTDENGKYSIDVPGNVSLSFSFIGFQTQEIAVSGQSVINITLKNDISQLNEVVVTAQGIQREKRSLGYAVSEIKGDVVNKVPEQNFVNSLNGKVSGVQVTSGGAPGQAARITIRGGAKSISGDNQPLFVIDGIPVSNDNDGSGAANEVSGAATPNRVGDINPNDIESISVLKGSAASVLYGNRGSNGVVLITTKSGKGTKGKPVITVNSNIGIDNALRLPSYQTKFAQGNRGAYLEGTSLSWGPEITGQQVTSAAAGGTTNLTVHDPRADFLKTGVTINNNVSISQTLEKTTFYVSVGQNKQTAIVPNQGYSKANFRTNVTTNLSDKITAGINVGYTKSNGDVPYLGQDGNNPFFSLFHVPVSWDLNGYGYQNPTTGRQINFRGGAFDNPLWTVNKTYFNTKNDHFIGGLNFAYTPTSWLNFTYRLGMDQYTDNRQSFRDIYTGGNPNGYLSNDIVSRQQITSTFVANLSHSFNDDFSGTLSIGHDYNQRKYDRNAQTATMLALPGIAHMNNATAFDPDYEYHSKRNLIGTFADLRLDYRNYLFLGVTVRNEWSSTLPQANRSFLYPGVNASFVFTEAFNINPDVLNFGKVRLSWAKTARDTDPYRLQSTYILASATDGFTDGVTFPYIGLPGYMVNSTVNNPNLKPEFTREVEAGVELKFFKNRLGVDFTYFNNRNTDGIISLDVAPSTGASSLIVNSGRTTNKGIEVGLDFQAIKTKDFNWNVGVVYSRIRTEVNELYGDLDKLYLGGFSGNPAIYAVKGERYGSIIGAGYKRTNINGVPNPNGAISTDADGYPLLEDGLILGHIEPNWTGGITNTFTYKGIRLSALFDTRQGGHIFSGTSQLLDNYGVSDRTLDRGTNIVFDGVDEETGVKNDVSAVKDQDWYGYVSGSNAEAHVYKNNWVKLREANLSYTFNIKRSILQSIDLGVYGRNLALWTKVPDIDPESSSFGSGNGQGASRMAYPSTRSLGVNVKLTF